jgi:hypothetical protein
MRSIATRNGAACVLAGLTFVVALALAGCSGSSSGGVQPGPGASSTSATSSADATYASSSDVVSALKSAGHPCTAVSGGQGASPSLKAPGLRSATSCAANTVAVFDDHTDALAYATLLTSAGSSGLLIGSTSERAVVGPDWVVVVPDDVAYAEQVKAALGGTMVGGASASSG